jgi:DNA-binding GntR family transcriptional regulator
MVRRKPKTAPKVNQDQKAYRGICQMLFNDQITPGQKIGYEDLASNLGMSTTPVIHALKWLEFKGIVSHEPNKGYFVNESSINEVREIYESRLVLEVSLVPFAVEELDESGLEAMAQALEGHNAAVAEGNYYKRLMTDKHFHLTLASLAKRSIQFKLLGELFDLLLLKYSKSLILFSIMETSQHEHARICELLKQRAALDLQDALTDHLLRTKQSILKGLDTLLSGNGHEVADYFSV